MPDLKMDHQNLRHDLNLKVISGSPISTIQRPAGTGKHTLTLSYTHTYTQFSTYKHTHIHAVFYIQARTHTHTLSLYFSFLLSITHTLMQILSLS